jgi:hypothetical protein
MSTVRSGVVLVGLVLALAGCASEGFSVLEGEQGEKDRLPASFDAVDLSGYDLASSRWSASYDGRDFFVIVPESGTAPCLAVAGDGGPLVACGGSGHVETQMSDGTRVQFMPGPAIAGDGWTVISDNIRVRP